jgi:glucokinase
MDETSLRAGVDVGGTKIAVGTVDGDGLVTALEIFPTQPQPETVLRLVGDALAALLLRQGKTPADLSAAGLAFPAHFDPSTGRVITAPNVPAFVGLDPRSLLETQLAERFSKAIPVAVDNDTCAAVLAEARFGAGRGIERLFYLTVSTGVGGARYDRGRTCNVEPGIRTFPDPENPGVCLEELAGGAALARLTRRRIREAVAAGKEVRELTTVLEQEDLAPLPLEEALCKVSARHLGAAAELGDAFSIALLANSARLAAASLRQLLLEGFGEQRLIIGGSVALKTTGYVDRLKAELATAFRDSGDEPPLNPFTDLVEAGLGDDRGVLGAALLTRRTAA